MSYPSRRALLCGMAATACRASLPPAAAQQLAVDRNVVPTTVRQLVPDYARTFSFFPKVLRLRLFGQSNNFPTERTLAATAHWRQTKGESPLLLTNAGMFHAGHRPVGLHIEAGHEASPLEKATGKGNFYLLPNGVFDLSTSGQARISETSRWTNPGELELATQSGPLLVYQNQIHNQFRPDSEHRAIRSGIGLRATGEIVIAISENAVRFFDFASLFRDTLACPDALYLDGTISRLRGPDLPNEPGHPGGYGGVLVVDEWPP